MAKISVILPYIPPVSHTFYKELVGELTDDEASGEESSELEDYASVVGTVFCVLPSKQLVHTLMISKNVFVTLNDY